MSGSLRAMVISAASPGHAYPGLALASGLRARGHDVLIETSDRWRNPAEELGLRFASTQERGHEQRDGGWIQWAVAGARALLPVMRDYRPDVVAADVVMPGAPLAAEVLGVRWATLMPLVYTRSLPGFPVYPFGFLPPRTPLGGAMWRAVGPPLRALVPHTRWVRKMPALINAARAELGLPRRRDFCSGITSYGTISEGLVIVATFPQLEYPRRWPPHVRVTGPMLFELPYPMIELPEGDCPLVLVAASTAQEPESLVEIALAALEDEPVRIVATTNRPGEIWSEPLPGNATVVDWLSYAQVMPGASLLVCNGGHGTVVRALADGVPMLISPLGGDQAENGARVAWAGAGLMLPARLRSPSPLRWAVRRLLADPHFTARAQAIAAWSERNDGTSRAAVLVERYAPR